MHAVHAFFDGIGFYRTNKIAHQYAQPQQHLSVARAGLFIRPRLASWPVVVSGEGVPGLSQGRFRHVGVSVWESSVSVLALQFAFRFGITKELLLFCQIFLGGKDHLFLFFFSF